MEQVTIKEIASLCGVGISTVSRAINNHPDVNPETKQKILDAIEQYHYVPNNSARNLKRTESNAIAVLVKGISNPFYADMIQIFERAIHQMNYTMVLRHIDESEDEVDSALHLEREKKLKGIIFLGGAINENEEELDQLSIPYIFSSVAPESKEDAIAAVAVDDYKESSRMVDFLIRSGHKKIALLMPGRTDGGIGLRRLNGYKETLLKNNLEYDEELVFFTEEEQSGSYTYSMERGYDLTKKLLKSGKEFTCIFAVSDQMAVGACKALFEAGKKVPEDYSVAGFDGLSLAKFYEPTITTICQPRKQMAEETMKILIEMIRGTNFNRKVIFEADLIEGASTKKI